MSTISIKIQGLAGFEAAMKKSPQIVGRRLQESLKKAAFYFHGETLKNIRTGRDMWKSPIDTGFMWTNIYTSIFPLRAEF